jgi:hypothetical protein
MQMDQWLNQPVLKQQEFQPYQLPALFVPLGLIIP